MDYNLDDSKYLSMLEPYFTVSGFAEADGNFKLKIREEYQGTMDTHIFAGKSGRILIMRKTELEYDDLLLFTPLGTLEESSVGSDFNLDELEWIIGEVSRKGREFERKLIRDLCESKRRFNLSFRSSFKTGFDFFLECDSLVEVNIFCRNMDDFKDLTERISLMIDTIHKKKIQELLEEKVDGSIDALRKIFKKKNRTNDVKHLLDNIRDIRDLRKIKPVHNTDEPLEVFLKRFNKKYPNSPLEWCDLSILVVQQSSKIFDNISNFLDQ